MTRWLPDAGAALFVLFVGVLEFQLDYSLGPPGRWWFLITLVVFGTAVAAGLTRRAPAVSLALVWLIALCQSATGTPLLLTQGAVLAVAFGTARWGSRPTLWASAVSIPVGSLAAIVLIEANRLPLGVQFFGYDLLTRPVYQLGIGLRIGGLFVVGALLGTPWLAGLVMRVSDRARRDRERAARERRTADEAMRIREAQTRLARDVHDVVGHSLAVILAQAESGRYLPDDDPGALKSALATIATFARTSLQDVRRVLSETRDPAGDLDSLIANLRAGGREVVSTQLGTPRPLTPHQQATAYHVLQEMLTNAIRHGSREGAIAVQRTWDDLLTIEVRNAIPSSPADPAADPATAELPAESPPAEARDSGPAPASQSLADPAAPDRLSVPHPAGPFAEGGVTGQGSEDTAGRRPFGSGVAGMRERLATVDGTLSTERRADVFVATARIPVV